MAREAWRRIFETEQNTYTKTGYRLRQFIRCKSHRPMPRGARLVLTLARARAARMLFSPCITGSVASGSPAHAQPKLLLDASEIAFMGDYPPVTAISRPTACASRSPREVPATVRVIRPSAISKSAANRVKQVDPIAPTPRDFVEEWLAAPWKQSAAHPNRRRLNAGMRSFIVTTAWAISPTPAPMSDDRSSGRSESGCMASTEDLLSGPLAAAGSLHSRGHIGSSAVQLTLTWKRLPR